MRRVLLIAYQFPPFAGSSGVQRAFRFACHLPQYGWSPVILTAHPRAYELRSYDLIRELPDGIPVIRAPAWDAKRHFSVAGRYPGFLGRPDRWRTWKPGAILAGLYASRRYKPDALWSTFPIATAHSIGATLANRTGLPWIADFRDPMAQEGYPPDPDIRRSLAGLERLCVERAAVSTLTTPGAVHLYRQRYPDYAERFKLLENGYDEETFARTRGGDQPLNPERLTLLHSGIMYPSERDPSSLFSAMAQLREIDSDTFARLVFRFRAPVYDEQLRDLARRYRIESHIEILPPIAYAEAVQEMCRADGLLILQAPNCNAQIPAKFYEYARAGRPILALTDPAGDTADVARAAGITAIAPLSDEQAIRELIANFVKAPSAGSIANDASIAGMSRRGRTAELSSLLDSLVT